jgi:hypothetical protein
VIKMGMMRRQARRRGVMRVAATASMVSSARNNRAQRKAIENSNEQQAAPADQAPMEEMQPAIDPTVELKKYNDLLGQGIITQEEFDAKKKELLGL